MTALGEVRSLLAYHRRHDARLAHHDHSNVYCKAVRDLNAFGLSGLAGRRVLDLGCGQRYAFALQACAAGATVTALDTDYVAPGPLPAMLWHMLRHDGLKRAAKSAVRMVLFDRRYYTQLEAESGTKLRSFAPRISFVVADPNAARYELASESFDVIASNAVVEHVRDVYQFAAEVKRLLAPGGCFYCIIHNFYSLSGGHNTDWSYPDDSPPANVPPWDHLRANRFPPWVYLNRLKPEEYEAAFSAHLDVVQFEGVDVNHDPGKTEGARFLTQDVEKELAAYPSTLLLTRAWSVICRKGDA